MGLLHFHRDRHWRMDQGAGIYALYQCKCGAKRTRWVNLRIGAPVPDGFPPLRDRHNRTVTDSGWVKP